MFRVVLAALVLLVAQNILWAGELNWGIKYGLGTSTLRGEEIDYELRYDILEAGQNPSDFGYLKLRSHETSSNISHQAGAYVSVPMIRNRDSISLHAELLWHRYAFSYRFADSPLSTNQLLLAAEFADTLSGSIDKTMDFITLPVMLRLNQELAEEDKQKAYQGAFLYLGPSFSFLVNNHSLTKNGIRALDQDIADFVSDSQSDADPNQAYASRKVDSGTDELSAVKTDFVIGAGINLKNIFNLGIGKDEFTFDIRYTTGMHDLGGAPSRKAFVFRSIMFSIGSRL